MPSVQRPQIQAQTEGTLKRLGVKTNDGVTHQELHKLDTNKDKKLSDHELSNVDQKDKAHIQKAFAKGSANTSVAFDESYRTSAGGTAVKHGAGLVVENAAHVAGHGTKLAGRAVPGLGAAVNGYFAYQNVSHAVDAGKRGNVGSAALYSLAGALDGTSAVINGAGAITGVGSLISVPVNLGLGVVSSGLSIGAAYLDD